MAFERRGKSGGALFFYLPVRDPVSGKVGKTYLGRGAGRGPRQMPWPAVGTSARPTGEPSGPHETRAGPRTNRWPNSTPQQPC